MIDLFGNIVFQKVKKNDFKLKFKYPTEKERQNMNIVNRDMSAEEKKKLSKNEQSISELLEDLKNGTIQKENLSQEMLNELKVLLGIWKIQ